MLLHRLHLICGSSSSGRCSVFGIFIMPYLAVLTVPPVAMARWCDVVTSCRVRWNRVVFHSGWLAAIASSRVDVAQCLNCVAREASRSLCW